MNIYLKLLSTLFLSLYCCIAAGQSAPSESARAQNKQLTVKEYKTTPDGKNRWIDHITVYDAQGRMIEEFEYGDYGRKLTWRAVYTYGAEGRLEQSVVYNDRGKPSKVRKFEYNADGTLARRYNYAPNGILNSFRQYEYSTEE